MARSLKLKNDDYLDSTSILHNKKILSSYFDKMQIYTTAGSSYLVSTAYSSVKITQNLAIKNSQGDSFTLKNGGIYVAVGITELK